MKIQLVQTGLDNRYMKNGRDMMAFPLGISAVASYVKHYNPEANIEIVDGDFETNLEKRLDGDIICFCPNILNIDIGLMQKLHGLGKTVILGGVHASQAWKEFVKFPFVDYVIRGDGEKPVLEASLGKPLDEIEGLSSEKKEGSFQYLPIGELPIIDRSLYDFERYLKNSEIFIETYLPSRPFRRMANIYTSKGCIWRETTGGCYFCGRLYPEFSARPPKQVWEEASYLVKDYNVDFLWDVSDSFTSSTEWLKKMAETRPEGISPYWYVYARVDELNEKNLRLLSKIGVYQALIGVETGDNRISEQICKGNNRENTIETARLAKKHGIKLLPSFVVGLPNETEKSLEKTFELAKEIVEINQCEEISVSMIIPLPGSKAYPELKKIYREKTGRELPLLLEGEELQKIWFEYMCQTDFDTAVSYMYKILELTPLKSTFGSPHLEIDPRMPGWNQLNAEARQKLFA